MNTGQSLLSIGALVLLSLSVLRVNNGILSSGAVLQDSKIGVLATSLGTSLIEEANRKAFDAISVDDAVTDISSLTSPYSLGAGYWETPETFNDFDDYNNYVKADTVHNIDLLISCKVNYVDPVNIDGIVMTRTWHKKITVDITSSFMRDTLKFSSIYSYWHFR
jgi:MSHA pilin protein MshD